MRKITLPLESGRQTPCSSLRINVLLVSDPEHGDVDGEHDLDPDTEDEGGVLVRRSMTR